MVLRCTALHCPTWFGILLHTTGTAVILRWCCSGTVLVLSWCCSGTVLVLCWYCAGAVLVLYWFCTGRCGIRSERLSPPWHHRFGRTALVCSGHSERKRRPTTLVQNLSAQKASQELAIARQAWRSVPSGRSQLRQPEPALRRLAPGFRPPATCGADVLYNGPPKHGVGDRASPAHHVTAPRMDCWSSWSVWDGAAAA